MACTLVKDRTVYSTSPGVTAAPLWIASRGDSQTTHATILADSLSLLQKGKRGIRSPDWHVTIYDTHLPRLQWVYCGVKGNDRADRLVANF